MPPARAHVVAVATRFVGATSMGLWGAFLVFGPFTIVPLRMSEQGRLLLDASLSLVWFAQHSLMVRPSWRRRTERLVGRAYERAAYAICSSVVLLAVVLLWQRSGHLILELHGPWRWLWRLWAVVAAGGAIWAYRSLGDFDVFGDGVILRELRGTNGGRAAFCARGPYRLVRHPLYLCTILLIWSGPTLTADRLLLNVSWTLWIVAAARLEERDLIAQFGNEYRRYRREVPMLLPWR
jgi:protein-S-isoprenylcysteine O-methyltransferase Ste14